MAHQDLLAVALFAAGLLIALLAAGLLVLNVIEPGPAAAFGIVGIGMIGGAGGLIAAGGRREAQAALKGPPAPLAPLAGMGRAPGVRKPFAITITNGRLAASPISESS